MVDEKHTFCRICEPYCPLIAEVDEGGDVKSLKPDHNHPSGGVACHKGLAYLDVRNDPDRLNWPMRRNRQSGNFERTDWDAALGDIADRLNDIIAKNGPNAVAVFTGNPWAMSGPSLAAAGIFQDAIATQMRFSVSTQDNSNKFYCASQIYGSSHSFMVPDIYNTDYLLCVGSNPKVSRWTLLSVPNDNLDVLKRIQQRGGKVRFVNPRKIESSTEETGPTLLIKPGTDVYFLAAVLNEIDRLDGFDDDIIAKHAKHVDQLRAFIERYPPAKVTAVTGLAAEEIRQVAREIIDAPSASFYASTGVNQSRQGILACWLIEMLGFVTGNLGRLGGMHKPNGTVNHFPPNSPMLEVETSLGSFKMPDPIGHASLPSTIFPRLIENGDVRALILLGGNPLLTIAGGEDLRALVGKLDLVISLDILPSASGMMSDYMLPAHDWLERIDINIWGNGAQPIPYVQYSDPIASPSFERRSGWWMLANLLKKMGISSTFDQATNLEDGSDFIETFLSARGLSIAKMRELPRQTALFPQEDRAILFEWCLQHPDRKIDCFPQSFVDAGLFERCDAFLAQLGDEPSDMLKLISRRTLYMQNSWLGNVDKFRRGNRAYNPLYMNESDATRRGLFDGDYVRIHNKNGSIEARIEISNDVRDGVVAMSHGFGHRNVTGLEIANRKPGSNYNALMPTGVDAFEPGSYMSWLSAVPVEVERA